MLINPKFYQDKKFHQKGVVSVRSLICIIVSTSNFLFDHHGYQLSQQLLGLFPVQNAELACHTMFQDNPKSWHAGRMFGKDEICFAVIVPASQSNYLMPWVMFAVFF